MRKRSFGRPFLFKCDLFTKPSSGHTQGKLKNRCVFSGSFTLYAGATSNYISTGFYVVQLFLSVLLLLRRRRNCAGSGDGKWCGPMEFTEPLPIKPLATRAPGSPLTAAASGGLSAGLLAGASEVEPTAVSTADAESLIVAAAATGSSAEPARARIPLRFWIALTLSATVVGFLAAMGALYGTKNAFFGDLFTKTGSGQTYGKAEKRGRFSQACSSPIACETGRCHRRREIGLFFWRHFMPKHRIFSKTGSGQTPRKSQKDVFLNRRASHLREPSWCCCLVAMKMLST